MKRSARHRHAAPKRMSGRVLGPVLLVGAGIGAFGATNGSIALLAADQVDGPSAEVRRAEAGDSAGKTLGSKGFQAADVVSGSGRGAPNPGAATVTLPNGKSFTTVPGQTYSVPLGSTITTPSGTVLPADQTGEFINVPDDSRIKVTEPGDIPVSQLPPEEQVAVGFLDESEAAAQTEASRADALGAQVFADIRTALESAFGREPSPRVHQDPEPDAGLGARAIGDRVNLPEANDGSRLVGHELTHVVQQRSGPEPETPRADKEPAQKAPEAVRAPDPAEAPAADEPPAAEAPDAAKAPDAADAPPAGEAPDTGEASQAGDDPADAPGTAEAAEGDSGVDGISVGSAPEGVAVGLGLGVIGSPSAAEGLGEASGDDGIGGADAGFGDTGESAGEGGFGDSDSGFGGDSGGFGGDSGGFGGDSGGFGGDSGGFGGDSGGFGGGSGGFGGGDGGF